ncbi:FG-GAP-like repeat-containing protein [Pendulispora rubella]|uniref:FG-GAP-like repeat-containing protein n=1 Tax=Pendulispora rubella TaxID=2741070 RepID=A0ABZ2LIT5_9BACT
MDAAGTSTTLIATSVALVTVLGFACGSSSDDGAPVRDAGPDRGIIVDDRVDPLHSSVVFEPSSVVADGVASAKIIVTLRRGDLSPAPGVHVDLSVSGNGNRLSSAAGETDKAGTFSATLASTMAETKTVSATFAQYALKSTATFDPCRGKFSFLAPSVAMSDALHAPRALAAADFNGDRKTDLAVVSKNIDEVRILLGNGDGTFIEGNTYITRGGPVAIVTADFTSDGNPDLVVVNEVSGSVNLLTGKGDGTFANEYFNVSAYPAAVVATDLNHDGRIDLAIHSGTSRSTVSVLLGVGYGKFSPPTEYIVYGLAMSLASGDFNKDGATDLAAATHDSVAVLYGRSEGKFDGPYYPITDGEDFRFVATADFEGDGDTDIAIAVEYDTSNLLKGERSGTTLSSSRQPNFPRSFVTTGDFDGDGKADVLGPEHLLIGNGKGAFSEPIPLPHGNYHDNYETAAATADFNGDGKLDVAITSDRDTSPGQLSILLNSGCVP